jgi:uncharacterized protein YjbJ (UPF0337 family)
MHRIDPDVPIQGAMTGKPLPTHDCSGRAREELGNTRCDNNEEAEMGLLDKLRNKGEAVKGDAKQKTGKAIGNEQMQAEGKAGSAKGNVKQAGENVKDAL